MLPGQQAGISLDAFEASDYGRLPARVLRVGSDALTAEEQARVFAEMDKLTLSADDKAFVMDELRAKLDVDAVAGAATSPEMAAEIYAASLMAVRVDNAAERGYLAMLAARLKLDERLVAHLEQNVAATVPVKAA